MNATMNMHADQSMEEIGILKLYIFGQSQKSVNALANLRKISENNLNGKFFIEICDLEIHPEKAKQDKILAIPTLVKCYPPPSMKIIGDLSDTEKVLCILNEGDHTYHNVEDDHIYRIIVEEMLEGFVTLDEDGFILFYNKAFANMLGNKPEGMVGTAITNMITSPASAEIESFLKNGQRNLRREINLFTDAKDNIPVLVSASRLDWNGSKIVCMLFADLTAQKDAEITVKRKEEIITRMAYFDSLTDLPNRTLFMDKLGAAIREAERSDDKLAVIFIDLDNFKRVNDTMGHEAGDLLLKDIGIRFQRSIREADTLSRMGGDEFAVFMHIKSDIKEADALGRRLIQVASQPFTINNTTHVLSASMGIAIYPHHGHTEEELLKNADTAMYKSKAQGKNKCCLFDDSMREEVMKRACMEGYLREALQQNELSVFFQPQFDIGTGALRGMEALLRWHSKQLGNVPPSQFIPLAEENRLIHQYGKWMLRHACQKNKEWQNKGLPRIPVSVNISPRELEQDCFVEQVITILQETGLEACYLELEITESLMINGDIKAIDKLEALKKIGVGIVQDDFGTGYSSLSYLNSLPIQILKIDKSFIANLQRKESDISLVKAIISLAHNLGLRVVAEGVENTEQVNILKECRCDFTQGFLYSPPVDARTAEEFLKNKE
ncbi:EAL domain-containing protein [Sporomusa termitida]|uniref:Circadian clock protein KaiB n=1 Tax=Sporomusa termitida TaxID=2377 RepID=A0A517DR80_9FIRM|nr:EAL domain-containing protein [Sporomusa termitida]QDR79808.1 Circadian clock protein KaiB [Sporomusa termitida]